MAHWLYVNGQATLYPSQKLAAKAMKALIGRLTKKGYKAVAHQQDADRFILTHATEGAYDIYLHDEPPQAG